MEADNAKAANAACLLAIASGYAWNGKEWRQVRTPQPADGVAVPAGEAVAWAVVGRGKVFSIERSYDVAHYLAVATPCEVRPLIYGDTTPQPADGGAVAWMTPGGDVSRSLLWCEERCLPGQKPAPLYTAPVQAAPQEGECTSCETEGVFATDGSGPFDCYACGKKAARPSACELGAVRELVARWRGRCVRMPNNGRGAASGRIDAYKIAADELEAALQHRGDSRGGDSA